MSILSDEKVLKGPIIDPKIYVQPVNMVERKVPLGSVAEKFQQTSGSLTQESLLEEMRVRGFSWIVENQTGIHYMVKTIDGEEIVLWRLAPCEA